MRSALRVQVFVCFDCRLRQFPHVRRRFQGTVSEAQHPQINDFSTNVLLQHSKDTQESHTRPQPRSKSKAGSSTTTQSLDEALLITEDTQDGVLPFTDNVASDEQGALSLPEKFCLNTIKELRQRLEAGIASVGPSKPAVTGLSFEDAVKATNIEANSQALEKNALQVFKKVFAGQQLSKFMKDTEPVQAHKPEERRKLLQKLGIGRHELEAVSTKIRDALSGQRKRRLVRKGPVQMATIPRISKVVDKKSTLLTPGLDSRAGLKSGSAEGREPKNSSPSLNERKRPITKLNITKSRLLREKDVDLVPLAVDAPSVPSLSFDLSRVLFNPGVYQLQDPRSRVFNFSPYLQRILPVSEFNFDALNEYITSSKDSGLLELALKHQKKYLGSSSSMTGVLTHFHYLLSAWRPISVKTLSQSFSDPLRSFTQYQRGPCAIFLRWKNGIYAVDADREYDSENILMSLGKSMEKLLTLEEEEFERYRKYTQEQDVSPPVPGPEAYHYTELGDFLLRSQLDAYDSRLPGTGMFDLKTRAVVSIRMNVLDHASGMGYEIQNRFGDLESYEKEYFDMIRSAFLRYSLQVRMGRMDGVFVAYHNIERIFGFQYISLPEMDLHLHGTENRSIGDTEFKLSLGLLNEIFNQATTKMPETSLRFHFETRDSVSAGGSYMYIFAEAQTEEEAENIQNLRQAEVADFEARISNTSRNEGKILATEIDTISSSVPAEIADDEVAIETDTPDSAGLGTNAVASSKAAEFSEPGAGKLIGFILRVLNKVNGQPVLRPLDLDEYDSWDVEYTLEEMTHDQALATYAQCRGRRCTLKTARQTDDAAASYYLSRMKRLSEEGRHVRKKIDLHDAGKPIVVLDRVLQERSRVEKSPAATPEAARNEL